MSGGKADGDHGSTGLLLSVKLTVPELKPRGESKYNCSVESGSPEGA
jgi:hypothetical protein